jgi:hypothetical protein
MSKIDLASLTIEKAHDAMKKGDFSAVDLAKAYLDVISKKNKEINAYLEVYDDVLEQAKHADERFKKGTATKLTGIPFAIKDNILIQGKMRVSASKILENYHATYDATVIKGSKKPERYLLAEQIWTSLPWEDRPKIQLWRHKKSMIHSRCRRIIRRIGCSCGNGWSTRGTRIRHRRLNTPAGIFLWTCRIQAYIRSSVAIWSNGNGLVS